MVLGALPALLQRPLSAARRAPGSGACGGAGGRRGRDGVRHPRRAALRRHGPDPVAVVRGGGGGLAADGPHHVPARGADRARRAAAKAYRAAVAGGAAGRADESREPRRRSLPGARGRRPGLGGRAAPWARARGRRRGADRGPQPALPGRRDRAIRLLGVHRRPAARGCGRLARPHPPPRPAHRCRALRGPGDHRLHRPDGAGRQRRPPGCAVRRPGARPRAVAARPPGRDRRLDPAPLLAARRARARRREVRGRAIHRAGLLRTAPRGAALPSGGHATVSDRGRPDRQPLGGRLRGP